MGFPIAAGACSNDVPITPLNNAGSVDGGSASGSGTGSSGGGSGGGSGGHASPGGSSGSSSGPAGAGGDAGGTADASPGSSGGGVTPPGSFRHPGALVTADLLAFLKAQIAAGASPWTGALAAAKSDSHASLSYTAKPPVDTNGDVGCGSYSSPDIHCNDEKSDVSAAYTDALIWAVSGDHAYAAKAIEIMNAWSAVMKSHSLSNAIVQSGWTGTVFARAAEIIRYTNAGWLQADVERFSNMLKTAYLPYVINGAPKTNGNWELSCADALIQIAVFLDDHASFDAAVAMWKRRVPAYLYLTSDGPQPVTLPNHAYTWYAATSYFDGLCQETCRDLLHAQFGLAAMINAAETARIQGVDLYSLEAKRITAALELHAGYIDNHASSSPACPLSAVSAQPMWEIAYNEYANRLSMPLPNTKTLVLASRPTGINHHMNWETLTHGDVGSVGIIH